ncbi:PaRep2b protein [Pyrobaculum sp. WP30]|nr:PaRep2b protein [Pyrobaculum sp. WP30]
MFSTAIIPIYCLAKNCADDGIVRKFATPALELVMLDKALNNKFDRKEALLLFGEMYATAVAGDGTVGRRLVKLAVGGELSGGAALLRLATLHLLNQLLPKELKFNVRIYVDRGRYYTAATGENAKRFMRFLAVTAPSAGGEYLSDKFEEFVKEVKVEVRLDKDSIRLTKKGRVVADLILSEGGVAVKYNVYLRDDAIVLQFQSTDRSRVELAACLFRLAGISAEVSKLGDKDEWRVEATTNRLAAGSKELRDALAEIVRKAVENGWVEAGKAEGWLEKLEGGLTLREGWPRYYVGLVMGALVVIYRSTDPVSIEDEARRFREMGLKEGVHFSVKMPEGGKAGYVSVLKEGLAYAAWLSDYGSGEQQRLAAEFVEYILQRAKEEGEEVYEKARKIIEEGKARRSLRLEGFEGVVEVNGRKHVVKVIGWGAELEENWSGKKLLRIRITAEVDGVEGNYMITFSRRRADNAVEGRATASADAPGGREADAERFSALIKALTGREPRVYRRSNGAIEVVCGREHLDGFARYAELADAIEEWLEKTGQS